MVDQFPKRCSCGLVHSSEAWAALPTPPRGGVRRDEWEEMQFRNCQCGSTLVMVTAVYKTEED